MFNYCVCEHTAEAGSDHWSSIVKQHGAWAAVQIDGLKNGTIGGPIFHAISRAYTRIPSHSDEETHAQSEVLCRLTTTSPGRMDWLMKKSDAVLTLWNCPAHISCRMQVIRPASLGMRRKSRNEVTEHARNRKRMNMARMCIERGQPVCSQWVNE